MNSFLIHLRYPKWFVENNFDPVATDAAVATESESVDREAIQAVDLTGRR